MKGALFMWLQTCARCGDTLEVDCGGWPQNPEHPYFNKWICDDCEEELQKESEKDAD